MTAVCFARAQTLRVAVAFCAITASVESASAQPGSSRPDSAGAPEPAAAEHAPVVLPRTPRVQIHGFASEGAFATTANDYLGSASRASLELFEAGINVSTDVADRLRV